MITCGNCHGKHTSVDEVRSCYGDYTGSAVPEFASDPATTPQLNYINVLIEQKDHDLVSGMPAETLMDVMGGKQISKQEASALIRVLKACPGKAVAAANNENIAAANAAWPSVPAGRYAIYRTTEATGESILRFYQVDKPENGKWAGRVFLSLLVGSPGNWTKLSIKQSKDKNTVMAHIGKDARAAAVEFGRKAKVCGRCLSPLSHVRSRAAGYGQACAEKLGWPYPSEEEARRILHELGIDISDLKTGDEPSGTGEFVREEGLEPEWTLS